MQFAWNTFGRSCRTLGRSKPPMVGVKRPPSKELFLPIQNNTPRRCLQPLQVPWEREAMPTALETPVVLIEDQEIHTVFRVQIASLNFELS
mmetsp:Transcript_8841/g.21089  ORF Transcript_8841/g.21089 Transcript_8841/m.21089 type:complete len:91 (+) Transcript_8841:1383-1655(+)